MTDSLEPRPFVHESRPVVGDCFADDWEWDLPDEPEWRFLTPVDHATPNAGEIPNS